jgi:DNA-binding MarR family transcriptional regulator
MSEMESDRRNKVIQLTKKGREYAGKTVHRITEAENRAMKKLDGKAKAALIESLRLYGDNFREYMQENIRRIGKKQGSKNEK